MYRKGDTKLYFSDFNDRDVLVPRKQSGPSAEDPTQSKAYHMDDTRFITFIMCLEKGP